MNKSATIKAGTLAIVVGLGRRRKQYKFGTVLYHTAGHNWMVNTIEGNLIYTDSRIYPVLETAGIILNAERAWQKHSSQFLEAIVSIMQKERALSSRIKAKIYFGFIEIGRERAKKKSPIPSDWKVVNLKRR